MFLQGGRLRKAVAVGLTAALLAGCAGTGPKGGSSVVSQEQRMQDTCFAYLQPIISANDRLKAELDAMIGQGAAVGGIGGALGSAIAGGDTGDIVAAGLVGAAAGALAGYIAGKNRQNYNQAQMRASIEADAYASYGRMSVVGGMIQDLGTCRRKQIDIVEQNFRQKKITAAQANAEAARIDSWMAQDDIQIAALLNSSAQDAQVYSAALAQQSGSSDPNASLGATASYQGEPLPPKGKKKKKSKAPKPADQVQARHVQQKDIEATRTADKAETDTKMANLKRLTAV